MADRKLFRTSALAALAASLAITSISVPAQARPDNAESQGRSWSRGGEARGAGEARSSERSGGWNRGSGNAARPAATHGGGRDRAARATPPAPAARGGTEQRGGWDRGRTGGEARGSWNRGDRDRASPPQTTGHGGTVTRSAPAGGWSGDRTRERNHERQRDGNWNRDRDDRTRGGTWTGRDDRRDGTTRGGVWTGRDRDRDGRSDGTWSRDRDGSRWSGGTNHRKWDRDHWRRDTRYDWRSWRNLHRDHYRVGRYYSPYRNWSYSRLSIGFFLQPLFYSQNYWINDPWSYRLPEVYGPYRWVRYYDDALLVDIYNGQVVDVIHDFFW